MVSERVPFLAEPDDGRNRMHVEPHEMIVEGHRDDGEEEHLGSSQEPPMFAPKRGLEERHIGVMAISGMLGTGIFLASGRALADAGPAGALLGYIVMGLVTIAVALTAAEMSALCPATGGFIAHAQKFVDPALGAAIGWNFAYALAIVQAVEITAASLLVTFWTRAIPQGLLITIFWLGMIAVNMMPVRVFGEIEFGFGLVKISLVIGLVILSLVLDLGLLPGTERLGFRYWRQDPFRELSYGSNGVIHGLFGRFLAVWSTLINAAFAFAHIQLIAIAGAETVNPRRAIPKALFRTSIGVFALYVSVIFSIGLILPATHPGLRSSATSGNGSPFAIAAREAGIGFVGSIINAVVLTSAFSSGVTSIFVSSRSLVALAEESNAPAILKRTHERTGVPYVAVLTASSLGALSYLSLFKTTAEALALLVGLSAVAGLVAWCVLCFTYLRMQWGMKVQGFTRNDLPYQAPLQPLIGWFAFIVCLLTLIFNGFAVFLPGNYRTSDFLSSYSNLFLFVVLYYSWRRISNISTTSLGEIKLSGEFKAARGDSSGDSPVVAGYELVPEAPA